MKIPGVKECYPDVESLIRENQRMPQFPRLSGYFSEHPEQLPELVSLAVSGREHPFPEYSSWLLLHISRQHPQLLKPFQEQIENCILNTLHPSVLRNLLGVSLCYPAGEPDQGILLDRLFSIIADPASKPGHMIYSTQKIAQFLKIYPELEQELKAIISLREQEKMSPGMTVCIRKILNPSTKKGK